MYFIYNLKEKATQDVVILCRKHQMEMSVLGQWHLSITFSLIDRTDGLLVILPAPMKTPYKQQPCLQIETN